MGPLQGSVTHPLVKMISMTNQLHLIIGGDDELGAPQPAESPSWRLDSDTIALGRQGIAEARAALRSLRPVLDDDADERPAA